MNSSEEQKGAGAPDTGGTPSAGEPAKDASQSNLKPLEPAADGGGVSSEHEDGYPHEPENVAPVSSAPPVTPIVPTPPVTSSSSDPSAGALSRLAGRAGGGGKTPPPPPGGDEDDEDEDDGYMLRMSFLEHL